MGQWAKGFDAEEVGAARGSLGADAAWAAPRRATLRACRWQRTILGGARRGLRAGSRMTRRLRLGPRLPLRPPTRTHPQVFAAEQSTVIAQLPSMDDDAAPNYFEAPSAGAVQLDVQAFMQVRGLVGQPAAVHARTALDAFP